MEPKNTGNPGVGQAATGQSLSQPGKTGAGITQGAKRNTEEEVASLSGVVNQTNPQTGRGTSKNG
jgi:hypothetical protein